MFNSEEDVKNKIVFPYLLKLGFDCSELSFEGSFNLAVGTNVVKIHSERQIKSLSPRFDILIKRDERNLCIFEIKNDDTKITDDDIQQAVSYARLLDQIAPICVITNGKEWQLVDSITKQNPDLERIKSGKYEVALPSDGLYEALVHFLGYSEHNILEFCRSQVNSNMVTLKGSHTDSDKKYIEELYVPSAQLTSIFDKFMQSRDQCFVVVGDSGSGKTCWVCNTAERLIEKGYPVFFYRGLDIKKGILYSICEDLNWELSPSLNEQQALKRVLELFQKKKDVPVLILVDGLDEIESAVAREIADSLLKKIDGRNVKFIATCKSFSWEKLLSYDGIPTLLSIRTFKSDTNVGYFLGGPEELQFHGMIKKYRDFYDFKGMIQNKVLSDCKRNPYLLRIMFEVAAKQKLSNITYTALEFFNEYFSSVIRRFQNGESTQAILFGVAKILYDKIENHVDITIIRSELGIPVTEQINERLFELNILEKQEESGIIRVGFYFKKFRDFIIAFKVLKLDKLSTQDLNHIMCNISSEKEIKRDVINLYYVLCSEEHKRVLDQPAYEKALEYITQYEEIINRNFPAIKDKFTPFTKGEIGFLGYITLFTHTILAFGYRVIEEGDPRVLFLPVDSPFFSVGSENLPVIYGTSSLHYRSSLKGFEKSVIKKDIIENEIEKQLNKIIDNGLLYEDTCVDLLAEKVVAEYIQYYAYSSSKKSSIADIFPLKLHLMRKTILYKRAYRIISDRLIQEKIYAGEIKTTNIGGYLSYTYTLNQEDLAKIEQESFEKAEKEEFLESDVVYINYDAREKALLDNLSTLQKSGLSEINALCPPDLYDLLNVDLKMTDSIKEFLHKLLVSALDSYYKLVTDNFPSFKSNFRLFQQMPIKCFWVLAPGMHLSDFYMCHAIEDKSNSGVICIQGEVKFGNWAITYKGATYKCFFTRHIGPWYAESTHLPIKVDERLVLFRTLVYQFISHDFRDAFSEFSKQCLAA